MPVSRDSKAHQSAPELLHPAESQSGIRFGGVSKAGWRWAPALLDPGRKGHGDELKGEGRALSALQPAARAAPILAAPAQNRHRQTAPSGGVPYRWPEPPPVPCPRCRSNLPTGLVSRRRGSALQRIGRCAATRLQISGPEVVNANRRPIPQRRSMKMAHPAGTDPRDGCDS